MIADLTGCCRRLPFRNVFMTILYWLDFFLRKGVGKFLGVVVHALVISVVLIIFGIILPYQSQWIPSSLIIIIYGVVMYFAVNILWHYRQASATPSGRPIKSSREPQCRRCKNHKAPNVHHCSICDECVVNMDHHCIWINRCVGAGNHRYFVQFTAFLSLGCFLKSIFSFPTFYYIYYQPSHDVMFCNVDLDYFWVPQLCSYGNDFIITSVFFSYCLCTVVAFLVASLLLWNIWLISNGQTYIEFLKGLPEPAANTSWSTSLMPWKRPDFKDIWKEFLGLTAGRTFCRHILLPSKHKPLVPLHWDDQLPEQLLHV